MRIRRLKNIRGDFIVLLMDPLVRQLMEWVHGGIILRDDDSDLVSIKEMHQYVSVLLSSHTCEIRFEKY